MKNKIEDLRNHLFAQLEKLGDESCDLDKEIQRAASMCQIAEALIETGKAETEFLKVTNSGQDSSTGFFPIAKEQRKYFIEKETGK